MVILNNMDKLLEQSNTLSKETSDKFSKHQTKKPSTPNDGDKFSKHKDKKPSTDKTTIPPSPDGTSKVDQKPTVKQTPKTMDDYRLWIQWSPTSDEFEDLGFARAIEKAYFSNDTKQDYYK
jgi:hypothetical protein